MKAIKSLVAAAALLTTLTATAQTTLPAAEVRAARDDAFSEFVYDALGATPKIQFRKVDAKAASSEDKAAVAATKAEKEKREAEANAARRASMISGY